MVKKIDKLGWLETVINQAIRVSMHICKGEVAYTGLAFVDFIKHFTVYCENNNLTKDENITNMITIITNAQEKNDMLFVADILQYELIPYLKKLEADCLSNK